MLDFHFPELTDREKIEYYTQRSGQIGCDISFATSYLWKDKYDIRFAFSGNTMYKAYYRNSEIFSYCFPFTDGDIKTAVEALRSDAYEREVPLRLGMLSPTNAEIIRRLYPGEVIVTQHRDYADYIYQRENLASLSGKKYHAKRNHISRFMREHGDEYSVEELSSSILEDAYDVAKRWTLSNTDTGELSMIRSALDGFDALGLFGLVLYVSDTPVAMCIASKINDEVCDVNFEKAVDIEEAYAVINNEFAKWFDSFRLINREEDLGIEGLRKSKLSYHPDILLIKSEAVFR